MTTTRKENHVPDELRALCNVWGITLGARQNEPAPAHVATDIYAVPQRVASSIPPRRPRGRS